MKIQFAENTVYRIFGNIVINIGGRGVPPFFRVFFKQKTRTNESFKKAFIKDFKRKRVFFEYSLNKKSRPDGSFKKAFIKVFKRKRFFCGFF